MTRQLRQAGYEPALNFDLPQTAIATPLSIAKWHAGIFEAYYAESQKSNGRRLRSRETTLHIHRPDKMPRPVTMMMLTRASGLAIHRTVFTSVMTEGVNTKLDTVLVTEHTTHLMPEKPDRPNRLLADHMRGGAFVSFMGRAITHPSALPQEYTRQHVQDDLLEAVLHVQREVLCVDQFETV